MNVWRIVAMTMTGAFLIASGLFFSLSKGYEDLSDIVVRQQTEIIDKMKGIIDQQRAEIDSLLTPDKKAEKQGDNSQQTW